MSARPEAAADEVVVLLHGMGRSALSMKPIQWALARRGYRTVNISYPSTRFDVENVVHSHLVPALKEIRKTSPARIHFVTHSLGGLLVRHYHSLQPASLPGRTVMLGPPNGGSELADVLKKLAAYRLLVGPAGQQLGTGAQDLPRALGPARFEVGVIAGDRTPFYSWWLPAPNDGKVSVESTRLAGMTDFIVVHHAHTWLPWRNEVIRQVLAFLETGRFTKVGQASRLPPGA